MKKYLLMLLSCMLACSVFVGCGAAQEPTTVTLGNTEFSLTLPAGYANTAEDFSEDQIAYYYKDDNHLDFEVYAWEKEGYTLEDEADYFATEYGSVAEPVTINNLDGFLYVSEEEYDGSMWTVYNYMFEDSSYILELCFWTDNSEEELTDVKEIINSLTK